MKRRSAPLYGPYGSGRTFFYCIYSGGGKGEVTNSSNRECLLKSGVYVPTRLGEILNTRYTYCTTYFVTAPISAERRRSAYLLIF